MSLGLLSPAGLVLLLGLPLLALPYLLRRRHPRVVVPALFLYEGLPAGTGRRTWGRLRLPPRFFLQLLILLLLAAAAARPVLRADATPGVALVLDTSASMQALDAARGEPLFVQAKAGLRAALEQVPTGRGVVLLYTTNPFGPAETHGGQTPERLLDRLTASDAPDPDDEALAGLLGRLATGGFERVVFFTDREVSGLPDDARLRVETFGPARSNVGIHALHVHRSPFFPDRVQAGVRVGIPADARAGWRLVIEDGRTGRSLASRSAASVDPGEREIGTDDAGGPRASPRQRTFAFSDLPRTQVYRVRVVFDGEGADGLALDNEAVAVLPEPATVSVLLVSPDHEAGDGLARIANLRLTRLRPEEYDPARATRAQYTCVIFHLTTPQVLPDVPAAFLLPPEGNPLFRLGDAAPRPAVTDWTLGHPLTSYLTVPLLAPAYAHAVRPAAWNRSVIESTAGALVLVGERNGRRYVVTGFDLLPYLGRANLPASILTLNVLNWLADTDAAARPLPTGTVLSPRAGVAEPGTAPRPRLRFPGEADFRPFEQAVVLDRQGVYRLREDGTERLLAVNLTNADESTSGRPLRLDMGGTDARPEANGMPTLEHSVWPWLLLASALLCGGEWWWAGRRPA